MQGVTVQRAGRTDRYVGTLVGESTSTEFRLAVAHEAIREQDVIAVDAVLRQPEPDQDGDPEHIRVWAKVQRIERLNPLFPSEAGHELAATRTDPLDTVLSFSREMVSAVCQVLGAEPLDGGVGGRLDHLRYPPQPATSAYRPESADIARVVLGELATKQGRALDIATMANRPEIDVLVDGHAIVTRHLAILAMTGAGKSWTARRVVEQLAEKQYPIVIFDPHGDYSGLADVPELQGRVRRYYATFPIFEQEPETVMTMIESLGWPLANTHRSNFDALFHGARTFVGGTPEEMQQRSRWLGDYLGRETIARFGLKPDLYALADFVQACVKAGREDDHGARDQIAAWSDQKELRLDKWTAGMLQGLPNNIRTTAKQVRLMEGMSRSAARSSEPLPQELTELVAYGRISVVSLAGYSGELRAALYAIIADALFTARVSGALPYPALLLLEEAHNFAPARPSTEAEQHAVATTRQIAQEGRKFGMGLVVISQRPSRLDETTLAMCNSYIIMRMVNPDDQGFVRRVVETLGEDDAKLLPGLDVGEAILSGQLTNFPVLVKVKEPVSKGEREEEDAFVALERARTGSNGRNGS